MGTQRQGTDVVFLSGRRTPFGTFGGSLKGLSATELGAHAARAALSSAGIGADAIQHVIFGNALQTSADAIYLARHIGLKAGIPQEAPALTLNRLCGSGFQSIVSGAQEILLGEAEVCLCGGALEDTLWAALTDSLCGLSMAQTAEKLAGQYGVGRAEADDVAHRSQQRAKQATDAGRFAAEIAPISLQSRKGEVLFGHDEHMRPDTTREALAALRPYFRQDGLVTAGNASGIGDGAAAVVIASAGWADRNGIKPIGRLVSWGLAGVDPSIMGIGPAPASRAALERAGLRVDEMDLVEVNEAFAPQFAAVARELELDADRTNVDGGAIALTHPLAASGTRITVHLLHELRRRGGRYGLGTACIGGGQGIALIVEAF